MDATLPLQLELVDCVGAGVDALLRGIAFACGQVGDFVSCVFAASNPSRQKLFLDLGVVTGIFL